VVVGAVVVVVVAGGSTVGNGGSRVGGGVVGALVGGAVVGLGVAVVVGVPGATVVAVGGAVLASVVVGAVGMVDDVSGAGASAATTVVAVVAVAASVPVSLVVADASDCGGWVPRPAVVRGAVPVDQVPVGPPADALSAALSPAVVAVTNVPLHDGTVVATDTELDASAGIGMTPELTAAPVGPSHHGVAVVVVS